MDLPWVEKYRPKTIEDLICDDEMLSKFKDFIKNGQIQQHLILTGSAGLGKTTTAKILAKEISEDDYLYICASGKGVDEIRTTVVDFCSTFGFGNGLKTVILDEFDGLSLASMMMLRNVLEEFVSTTRFILTCNYITKILDPIRSRCMIFHYQGADEKLIGKRCLKILEAEKVNIRDKKQLGKLIRKFYPDIRAIINNLEKFTHGGLFEFNEATTTSNIERDLIDAIKEKNWVKIRTELVGQSDFPELFKIIFDNADIIANEQAPIVRLHVMEGIRYHSIVVDQEINFMGCINSIFQEIED